MRVSATLVSDITRARPPLASRLLSRSNLIDILPFSPHGLLKVGALGSYVRRR